MRRTVVFLAMGVVGLAGCDKLKQMVSARPDVAATAGTSALKVERLAKLMNGIKGVPVSREAADFIANLWIDHNLFAQALASGQRFDDSATAVRVLWPELAELRGSRWHDTLLARRAPLLPSVADSIYQADQVRLLQHILIRVEPNAEPPARAAARKKAEAAYTRVKAGGDFAKLAHELSEDPGSRQDGGYLPPAPRGRWVTAFDSAGWSLAPGAITGLVETPFGFHIIRRPPQAEVRDRLLDWERTREGAALDSMYLDSLGIRKHLKVEANAPEAMRAALKSPDRGSSDRALARYDGGSLTVKDFLRWVSALGPTWSADLEGRPDSSLVSFARLISQNQLLLQQADSAGVQVGATEWASMMQRYRATLDTLRMSLDLSASDLADPAASPADRSRVAAMKIETLWDRIGAGGPRPRAIPAPLAALLRSEAHYSVNPAGIDRAVVLARDERSHADTSAAPGPAPSGAVRPPIPAAPSKAGGQ
jgi:PPIC-type PPIASE domain